MKISAIVVTYNRLSLLKQCIYNLSNQSYEPNTIVIVNNNSNDGTKEYLKNLNGSKFLIKNMDKNVGGAGGFSEGIKLAYEYTNDDAFWLMDDDAMPTADALKNLVSGAKRVHNDFGFICSNVKWKHNSPINVPVVDNNWNKFLPGNLIRVKIATFVSFMVMRKSVSRLGLPIAQMFIWGDDFEYSLRLHNYKPCYFVSNSVIKHKATSAPSVSVYNIPRSREKYLEYDARNKLYAVRKDLNFKELLKKLFHDIMFIFKIMLFAKGDKIRKMGYSLLGIIKGFFFNPKVEIPRKK